MANDSASQTGNQKGKPNQPQQGLIQEVAIGELLSGQMLTENQVKRG